MDKVIAINFLLGIARTALRTGRNTESVGIVVARCAFYQIPAVAIHRSPA
jgi:hypothetical protein